MALQYRSLRLVSVAGAEIRIAKFEGREHVVVPTVALMEGVIFPSNAPKPEFVPARVLERAPQGWDGRPVVMNHPHINGDAVSANRPQILEEFRFGTIFDAYCKDRKLGMDAWLDVAAAKKVGPDAERTIERARNKEPIEVSVGAFIEVDDKPGVYKGLPFGASWTNLVQDHLAMLSEGVKGACNNEMGCGAPRIARAHRITDAGIEILGAEVPMKTRKERIKALLAHPKVVRADGLLSRLMTASDDQMTAIEEAAERGELGEPSKPWWERMLGSTLFRVQAEEDMSDQDLRRAIDRALFASEPGYLGIDSVFTDRSAVVYAVAPEDAVQLIQRTFAVADDGTVTLKDDRQEVRPVTRFEPVTAAGKGGCGCGKKDKTTSTPAPTPPPAATGTKPSAQSAEGASMKTKEQRVSALIESKQLGPLTAEFLTGLTEDQLKALEAQVETAIKAAADAKTSADKVAADKAAADKAAADKTAADEATRQAAAKTGTDTPPPSTLTIEQFMEANPEIRDLVSRQKAADAARRLELVTKLKVAAAGVYTEAELNAMKLDQLERSAMLAKVGAPTVDYSGNGVPRTSDESKTIPAAPDLNARVLAARNPGAATK